MELARQLVTRLRGLDGVGEDAAPVSLALELDHDAVPQDIIAQHGADGRAAEALNQIAWACRNLKQYNKALTIYQYAVDNWRRKDTDPPSAVCASIRLAGHWPAAVGTGR